MRKFILILLLFASATGWSQDLPFLFKGRISNSDNGGYEGDVSITVVQNGSNVLTTQTASNGKYSLSGPINYTQAFDIVFSKSGLVTKKVHFDFSKVNVEDIPPGEFRPVESLDLDLFQERENIDFSFLDTEPVASFDWDTRGMRPRLDSGLASSMKTKIANLLAAEEQKALENEKNYQDAITAADAAFESENYEASLAKYEEALGYKPTEKYPSDRIVELDALIAAKKDKELEEQQAQGEYDNLISSADNLRDQNKLEEAVTNYKKASQTKPTEQYPKDQITELETRIAQIKKEKESQAAYDAAIQKADMFFKQNSIKAARDKYQEATDLKPSEQYPKDRLAEIEGKMKEVEALAEKKQKYDDAIAAADAAFNEENYEKAKLSYEEALTYEPSSSFAKSRLAICDEKLAGKLAEIEKQKTIKKLLEEGQVALDAKSFDDAIAKFDEVLSLEEENVIAFEKKALAIQLKEEFAKQAEAEKQFNDLVKQGDDAVGTEDFASGISKYEEALTLKNDTEVETKLTDAKAKLKAKEDLEAQGQEFQKLIEEGTKLLGEDKLNEAKAKFEAAQTIDANSEIPPTKIKEIDDLLAEREAAERKEENYNKAIAEADQLFDTEKWSDAKAKYEVAVPFAEDPAYANGRIEESKSKIAENASLAEKKANYDAAITAADAAFGAEKWEESKLKYKEALDFASDPAYANGRIDEIDAKLADLESSAEEKVKYEAAIAAADKAFSEENWIASKSKYEEAKGFTNDISYSDQKIAEIDEILANEKALEQKKAEITAKLAEGQQLYADSKLEDAKAKYEEVLAIDSKNETAKTQLDKINADIAALQSEEQKEEAFNKLKEEGFVLADNKEYEKAQNKLKEALNLKSDAEIESKIDEIVALQKEESQQEEIASLILDGEALFNANKFDEAKNKYQEVLAIDSENKEAKTGLEKSNKAIEELAAQNSELEQFNKLKADGLAFADDKKYEEAKTKLNKALEIQEDSEITAALEAIRQAELAEQEMASEDEEYNAFITEGDNLFSAGSFDDAIAKYKEAKGVKPSSKEPDDKIAAVKKKREDLVAQEKIDKQYQALIDKGDELVEKEEYIDAIQSYNQALALKPGEQLPVDKANAAEELAKNSKTDVDKAVDKNLRIAQEKIEGGDYDRAEQILTSTENLGPGPERIAEIEELRQTITAYKKRDSDYEKFIEEGQQALANEKYEKALQAYQGANKLKSNEQLPKDKIEEIDAILATAASSEQREKLYKEYMDKGANHQTNQDYELALSDYQNALEAKKGDLAAENKIKEVQQILDDLANESEADQKLKNKFNTIIGDANALFNSESYLPAKAKYEEALALIPTDEYAKSRVEECIKREKDLSEKYEEEQYRKIIAAADKNFEQEEYAKAKERYTNAVDFRSNDPYPKKKLAEIEAILNPTSVASMKLEDPGVPIEGSIIDGMALLSKAQQERDALQKQKLQSKMDKADQEVAEISDQKTLDRESARQEIVEVYEGINEYAIEADMKQGINSEILRKTEKEIEEANQRDRVMDYNINVGDQVQLNSINESIQLNYGDRNEVHMDNAETMDSYEKALSEAFAAQSSSDYGSSIASDQKLTNAKKTIQGEMIDDFEERDLVRRKVQNVEQSVAKANTELDRADYEVNHASKDLIDKVYLGVDNKNLEDAKQAGDNSESLVKIQDNIYTTSDDLGSSEKDDNYNAEAAINNVVINYQTKAEEEAAAIAKNGEELELIATKIFNKGIQMNQEETEFAYAADRQMKGYQEKTTSDQSGMDDNRKEAVEILKQGNKELAKATEGDTEKSQEKSLNNKRIIDNETDLNSEVEEKAQEALAINVAGVETLDKKARAEYSNEILSDEEERQGAQKGISNVYESNDQNGNQSTDKQKENSTKLDNSKRVITAETGDLENSNENKIYDAANKIHNIDDSPEKKAVIANSLGEEYPEGVTEESFAQNDQNGIMKAIITRRVVVIDGHADVYQRTQQMGSVTYSKNGKPITEHDWNSQTQGPHLVRHTK